MGRWKPMLPFGNATIIETVVARALEACARVILVTGYRGEELAALFRGFPRVCTVQNPAWPLGMFSSIRCGVSSLETVRFFVTPGDMPWIDSGIYATLAAWPESDVVFPVWKRQRGHPVLLPGAAQRRVLDGDLAAGDMKEIISHLPVREVPWRDDSILRDIDIMEDLA
jgi:molybdenum cofactor cytidylyltransferase